MRAVTTRGCVSATEPIAAGELARLLAHDTRTPLNAVQGFAELLLSGAAGPLGTEAVGYVAEIARAGRALEVAVALAQELAELDASVAATDVQLPELLREVGFTLVAAGGTRLPAVRGTAERWRRVLHLCRDHLAGGEPTRSPPQAEFRDRAEAALELVLRRADMQAVPAPRVLGERLLALLLGGLGAGLRPGAAGDTLTIGLASGGATLAAGSAQSSANHPMAGTASGFSA